MSGFVDRDGGEIQSLRDWFKVRMVQVGQGTIECVMLDRALKTIDELVAYKRDHSPALIRKDEIIDELKSEIVRLESQVHTLRSKPPEAL